MEVETISHSIKCLRMFFGKDKKIEKKEMF